MPFYVRNPTIDVTNQAIPARQMVIINDKLPPPPPYQSARHPLPRTPNTPNTPTALYPPPFRARQTCRSLTDLPQHILLQIVYATCPDDVSPDRLRRRLYWVAMYLRLTSRALYVASMHLLRSTYLPLYMELVKPPYTSDPFPLNAPSSLQYIPTPTTQSSDPLGTTTTTFFVSSLQSVQRETAVLDRFLVLKICDDVRTDETELHLGSEDTYYDLFELMQPRSRVEDLLRTFGIQTGVIAAEDEPRRASRSKKLVFDSLSLSLVQTDHNRRKHTLVEIQRTKTESLEVSAKRLIRALIANGVVPDPSSTTTNPDASSSSRASSSRMR
ncbi:protein-binding protein [Ceratobasidium sp. AG-Ba]|nr:protein-binding protein [Ceratobasidium sp. AG-Ba]